MCGESYVYDMWSFTFPLLSLIQSTKHSAVTHSNRTNQTHSTNERNSTNLIKYPKRKDEERKRERHRDREKWMREPHSSAPKSQSK